MVNLSDIQIGSVILNMIENVPSTISGTTLHNMIDQEIFFAERFTGDNISIDSVGDVYQPAIFSLSAASVLRMMEMQGSDSSKLKLGDFTVEKGANSPAAWTSEQARADGIIKLENLGQQINFFKANG